MVALTRAANSVGPRGGRSFLREAKFAGDARRRPPGGLWDYLPLSRPVRGGSRTFARGATCLWCGLGGFRPARSWIRPLDRESLPRVVAWLVGDAAWAAAQFRGSADRGARFRTTRRRSRMPLAQGDARNYARRRLRRRCERPMSCWMSRKKSACKCYDECGSHGPVLGASSTGDADALAGFRVHGETFIGQGARFWRRCFTVGSPNSKPSRSADEALTSIDRRSNWPAGRHPIPRRPAAPHPRRHPAPSAIPRTRPRREAYQPPSPLRANRARVARPASGAEAREPYQSTARPSKPTTSSRPRSKVSADAGDAGDRGGQALLAALAETDEIKVYAASGTPAEIQTSYGRPWDCRKASPPRN